VSYSVGVAGDYLLHVRLRSQAAAVPGSPFALRVEPGPPNALSTALPALRLISEVGEQCRVVMRTLDKMGNECTVGGGEGVVECSCNDKAVSTECVDEGDGTYTLTWTSEVPGSFEGAVKINRQHVVHSPVALAFVSTAFMIEHTEVHGLGFDDKLGDAIVVDERSIVRIKPRDRFGNAVVPTPSFKELFRVGVALPVAADLRGKEREDRMRHLDTMASITFEGAWLEDEPSVYELVLTPSSTDVKALHLWCEHSGEATRHAFVGSPFPITCTSTNVISEKIDTSGVMPGDYRIDLTVFEEAQKKWGACTIDAFASKATKLLTRFWASAAIEGLEGFLGVDALAHPWEARSDVGAERIWAHPPIELLDAVVRKLEHPERTAEVIVCAPQHKTKAWYVALCGLCDDQLKHSRGHLDKFSKHDCPSRLSEWPITLFHVPAREAAAKPPVPKLPVSPAARRR